ncbi:reverse transcriptase family protein [Pseudomonas promysalinigenes]|uniref:reverse transcriptase family protein n=1 Tax=Pseudomonas promysalinigenes TaxID=485898 RepID=UPI0016451C96|nr:reverse transcriptase family protein [Pseudomonas promysalinigenes]QXI34034.1 reverse transcriptase family protein [Pseudomonas promysalinigenes]
MDNIEDIYSYQGDVQALCMALELDHTQSLILPRAIARPDLFYRFFSIPKRTGGLRKIRAPYPALASIQKRILDCLLAEKHVHHLSFAYVKNKSAIDNAKVHLTSKEILKLDIQDYFPSIDSQMVIEALMRNGFSSATAFYISRLCTVDGALPQGACTSPILSNLVFNPIDNRLAKLAERLNLRYSRYADDIVISGERVPRNLINLIRKILIERRFSLNEKKCQLKLSGSKKIITGVSISSGVMKAPKAFKRELRSQIFALEKYSGDLSKLREFDPLFFERVVGRLNYLLQIEPYNEYARKKKATICSYHQKLLGLHPMAQPQ